MAADTTIEAILNNFKNLSKPLATRCNSTRLVELMTDLKLKEKPKHLEMIRRTPFGGFVDIPSFPSEKCLLETILSYWVPGREVFQIRGKTIRFTPEDVAVILGLSTRGQELVEGGKTPSSMFFKEHFTSLNVKSNSTCPMELVDVVADIDNLHRYAWAKAVHSDIMKSVRRSHKNLVRVWFYEHVEIATPVLGWPRINKWVKLGCRRRHTHSRLVNAIDLDDIHERLTFLPEEMHLLPENVEETYEQGEPSEKEILDIEKEDCLDNLRSISIHIDKLGWFE
ncbi:hypothetical protein QJS10_CPA16g00690 [Acorus calamus]|uniref:Aminotransferase-like plant mobile domain-containing protein n=1 Tax=Acorus calamus TaxID=4465 RepID=A0AAV9D343_ACOCL|nr:hypothetical protein QJS10_CPA16g00690 [Acorus calamus]